MLECNCGFEWLGEFHFHRRGCPVRYELDGTTLEADPILNDWESPETYDCDACKKVGHGCLTVASALGSDVHAPPQTLPPGWLRWAGFYACSPECAIIIWKRENL